MVELVTGHAGKAHATAEQAAGLNAGILGLDDYVLNVHDKLKITVVSANKVTIGTGELVMQGRHVSQGTPEDLIVTNGSQGQKRNDLIDAAMRRARRASRARNWSWSGARPPRARPPTPP